MGTSLVVIPQPKKRRLAKDKRAKLIEEGIKLAYDSLQSHLPYTHGAEETMLRDETNLFHSKCVKDYSRLIAILTELY